MEYGEAHTCFRGWGNIVKADSALSQITLFGDERFVKLAVISFHIWLPTTHKHINLIVVSFK